MFRLSVKLLLLLDVYWRWVVLASIDKIVDQNDGAYAGEFNLWMQFVLNFFSFGLFELYEMLLHLYCY